MTDVELRAALARIAWMADAGRQFVNPDPAVYRDLFIEIRDYALKALGAVEIKTAAGP